MFFHGGALPGMAVNFRKWVKRVLLRGDVLIAYSLYLAREITKLGLQIRAIPNIMDITQYPFQIRDKLKPRLFWMRSFEWYYNPMLAIRVLHRIQKSYPTASLTMGGPDKGLLSKNSKRGKENGK